MYSVSQFAKIIGVSKRTLQRWDKSGKFISEHLKSGHRRYTDEHVKIFIEMKTKKYKEKIEEIKKNIKYE
jgi:DNA-binding transcriptional MerR regulator